MSVEGYRTTEVAFEFGGSRNQQFLFAPFGERLRGRWTTANMNGESSIGFSAMPDIPGQAVAVDLSNKSVRIVDPLGFDENERILSEANNVKAAYFGTSRPKDTSEFTDLATEDLKSVLWALLDAVDAGDARLVHGAAPTREDVLGLPGRLRLRYFDSSQKTDKYASQEEIERFKEKYGIGEPVAVGPAMDNFIHSGSSRGSSEGRREVRSLDAFETKPESGGNAPGDGKSEDDKK